MDPRDCQHMTPCGYAAGHTGRHGTGDSDRDGIPNGWAILVRYVGPTDYRGARWIATADHPIGRAVVPYSYELHSGADNARTAADALVTRWAADYAAKYGVTEYPWRIVAYGHLPTGDYAFIVG